MESEDLRRTSAHSYGENADERGETSDEGSGWTTTKAAAKALGVSRRTVQDYVHKGMLQAIEQGEGVNKTFYVSIGSLNSLMDRRRRTAKDSPSSPNISSLTEHPANIGESVGELLRRTIERLEARAAEAAGLRARLELTQHTESTLREELELERRQRLEEVQREREERLAAQEQAEEAIHFAEQLKQESIEAQRNLERVSQEREEAQEEAERLREELEAEWSKGFWRRLFGG